MQEQKKIDNISSNFSNEEIGEILKQKREKLKLTREDVAQKSKIRVVYLEYIENNQLHKLPSIIYAKGYVKLYNDIVGSNIEIEEDNVNDNLIPPDDKLNKSFAYSIPSKKILFISIAVILIIYTIILFGGF